jgi:hypothetical protein
MTWRSGEETDGQGRDGVRGPQPFPRGSELPWIGLAAGLLGLSIEHGGGGRPTFPVRGWVLVGDEPAVGATVEFHPLCGGRWIAGDRPRARVQDDGSFELGIRCDWDGAPAGEYAVTVEWCPPLQAGGESVAGPSLVPAPYTRRGTTPLRAIVNEGTNVLAPFWVESRYP